MSKILKFDNTGDAYDASQTEGAQNGDILWIPSEGVVGLCWVWPIAVTKERGELHSTTSDPRRWEGGAFAPLASAVEVALKFVISKGLPPAEWVE